MEGETTGMSMATAVAASMVSCLTGCGVRRGLGVSASMDISGRLWAVDGLGPKSAALKAIGIKRILFPPRSENILEVTGLEMKVCREGMEAIMLLLEPHPLPQPGTQTSA
jgi:ATP-dependent Lon protease